MVTSTASSAGRGVSTEARFAQPETAADAPLNAVDKSPLPASAVNTSARKKHVFRAVGGGDLVRENTVDESRFRGQSDGAALRGSRFNGL